MYTRAAPGAVGGGAGADHEPARRPEGRPVAPPPQDGSVGPRLPGILRPRPRARHRVRAREHPPARRGRVQGRVGPRGHRHRRTHGQIRTQRRHQVRRIRREEWIHPATEGRALAGRAGDRGAAPRRLGGTGASQHGGHRRVRGAGAGAEPIG